MYVCIKLIAYFRIFRNKIPKIKIISNKEKYNFYSKLIGKLKSTISEYEWISWISDKSDESTIKYIGSFFSSLENFDIIFNKKYYSD